jgi:hypothetical protein
MRLPVRRAHQLESRGDDHRWLIESLWSDQNVNDTVDDFFFILWFLLKVDPTGFARISRWESFSGSSGGFGSSAAKNSYGCPLVGTFRGTGPGNSEGVISTMPLSSGRVSTKTSSGLEYAPLLKEHLGMSTASSWTSSPTTSLALMLR